MRFVTIALLGALAAFSISPVCGFEPESPLRHAKKAGSNLKDANYALKDALEHVKKIYSIGGNKLRQEIEKAKEHLRDLLKAIDVRSFKTKNAESKRVESDGFDEPATVNSASKAQSWEQKAGRRGEKRIPPEATVRGTPSERLKVAMDVENYAGNPANKFVVRQNCTKVKYIPAEYRCNYFILRFKEVIPYSIGRAISSVNYWRTENGYPQIPEELHPVVAYKPSMKIPPEDEMDTNASNKFMAAMGVESYRGSPTLRLTFPVKQSCGEVKRVPVRYICSYYSLQKTNSPSKDVYPETAIELVNMWRQANEYPPISKETIAALGPEDVLQFKSVLTV